MEGKATLVSTKKDHVNKSETAEYELMINGIGNGSGTVICEGVHHIEWGWSCTYQYQDLVEMNIYNLVVTLLKADQFPVNFKFTMIDPNGSITREFALSGLGENKSEEFNGFGLQYLIFKVSHKYPVVEDPRSCSPLSGLSVDLSHVLKNETFSDVTMTAGSSVFNLHKAVVAGRSKVFAAMLNTDMLEKRTNNISVQFDKDIVQEMINFMYTGKVQQLDAVASELIKPADMYELEDLKKMCMDAMVKNLSTENAAETLLTSEIYNTETFKTAVMKYVMKYFCRVVLTEGWSTLATQNPSLSIAVTVKYATMINRSVKKGPSVKRLR